VVLPGSIFTQTSHPSAPAAWWECGLRAAGILQTALEAGTKPPFLQLDSASFLPLAFGPYELIEEIGRGGMGVVYRAREIEPDRVVALKLMIDGPLASEVAFPSTQLRAIAEMSRDHAGIVTLDQWGEWQGIPYLVMELIPGRDLAKVCAEGPLSPRRAARILLELALAVQHAHAHGILHCDLKPSNVVLDPDDAPHITDFGIARRINEVGAGPDSGLMRGSPCYAAPEQVAGGPDPLGASVDTYGLGALLFHLLTGRPPFHEATLAQTLRQVLDGFPPPLRSLNPDLPPDLEVICLACLAKDPPRRYATAAALTRDLERFLAGRPLQGTSG